MKVHVVYGPPGTGKTTEMLRRVEAAVARGVERKRIAYLSFTRAAAGEALQRMNLRRSDKVCTLHALAYRILQISSDQIVTPERMKEFANRTGVPMSGGSLIAEQEILLGDELLSIEQTARARMVPPHVVWEQSHRPGSPALFDFFLRSYREWKAANGYVDFNDILTRVLERAPAFEAHTMVIDEAQDLSPLQWAVVRFLAANVEEVHIGGDDDQAIFEWSGADPHGMHNFEREHLGSRAEVLGVSHRIPGAVHSLANRIISRVSRRVPKTFTPRDVPGNVVFHGGPQSLRHLGSTDTLILYRNHMFRQELEEMLLTEGIPYSTLVGFPSPLDGRYGRAIRTYLALQQGHDVAKSAMDALLPLLTPIGRAAYDKRALPSIPWKQAVEVPARIRSYLWRIDFSAPVRVRLGSIHSAKGREAERVILHTGMSPSTLRSWTQNPDAEARVWYVGVTRAKDRLDVVEGPGSYPLW